MPATDSTRFLIQMVVNVAVCNFAKKKIAKIATKKQGKQAFKSYLVFIAFSLMLIGLNQALFFIFKPPNLYQQLNIPRSMPPEEIKKYEDELKVKVMQMQQMPLQHRIQNVRKIQSMVQVLTHPARRLSYDTFGQTDTSYAWAFKNHYFLLSTIVGSSIFYIMCTFINMISDKKEQIKAVFKLQIMVMILLFLWEIELIMKTQSRMHQHTDSLDTVYTAFPMFERRDMIKIILIPCMNIIKFFYRFYVLSEAEKKFLEIGKNPYLRQITSKTSQLVSKVSGDQHFQQKVQVAVKEAKKNQGIRSQIFALQRQALQCLATTQKENILVDDQILKVLKYFGLAIQRKQKQPQK